MPGRIQNLNTDLSRPSCAHSTANIPLDFAPFATFGVYAIISVINNDKSLLTAQAFTSLSLISLMTSPLLTFVQAVPQLLQSQACYDRIEAYLSRNPITQNDQALVPNVFEKTASNNSISLSPCSRHGIDKNTLISFRGADISWSSKSEPVFKNFSLDIGQGITMIIGPVGSGKSTLIETIIRETIVQKGHINTNFSDVAYCGQTPWIMNKSIRYNITCEDLVDEEWYNQCLSICSLKKDLMLFLARDISRGSYTEIFSAVPRVALQSLEQIDEEDVHTTDEKINANSPISLAVDNKANPRVDQQELDLSRRDGTWGVYRFYAQNAGLWTTCCFVISAFLAALLSGFNDGLTPMQNILTLNWGVTLGGTTTNRFNQDMDIIDMRLPSAAVGFIGGNVQQWLTIVLDLVLAGMAVILVAITTSLRDKFTPGEVGVALNLVLTFNQSLVQTINSWTQLEISIGAVSRVQQFAKTPSERRTSAANAAASHGWPREVLRNVSLNIKAGQKIAICGASGSGKTSLFMAILQMIDIQCGSILVDGTCLSDLDPEVVRSRVNVIPQEPFFLPETVRYNLDPHAKVTDDRLELAIQKVGLWDRVSGNGGLNMQLNPSTWSSGERQLLALARALVRDSPLLLLDEAASRYVVVCDLSARVPSAIILN
ncbi:unnamed protein product [Aspergillus oryzae]|nr:unnamed protein product [Aspergillus oryzae]